MPNVNFKSSVGILEELESAVQDVKCDPESLKSAHARISGCKHAIQVFAVSLEHAKMQGIAPKKLKTVEIE
jgi:hypothetical protein